MYSKIANKYLICFPPGIAKISKKILSYPRYYYFLIKGKVGYIKRKNLYKNNILFIAGFPKSGTTWLENMLSFIPGYTSIIPLSATKYEMKNKSSLEFDLPEDTFKRLENGLYILKMHLYGSRHNRRLLKKEKIKYCVMLRDIRDAAVSHYFYVRRTPWHPEHPDYKNLNIKEGLNYFCKTRITEWVNWMNTWIVERDKKESLLVKYEDLLQNTFGLFKNIIKHFDIQISDKRIKKIIRLNKFSRLKNKENLSRRKGFFRKGKTGDWKNYFDDEIKEKFKNNTGEILIKLGYEKNLNW